MWTFFEKCTKKQVYNQRSCDAPQKLSCSSIFVSSTPAAVAATQQQKQFSYVAVPKECSWNLFPRKKMKPDIILNTDSLQTIILMCKVDPCSCVTNLFIVIQVEQFMCKLRYQVYMFFAEKNIREN